MKKNILLAFLTLAILSCQETTKKEQVVTKQDTVKLWQANEATTTAIGKMQQLIGSFDASQEDAYVNLKNTLVDEFNGILTNCTMEGEAHQHLHDYLVPMKGMIDELSGSNTKEENQKIVNHYKVYLEKYKTIFK